MMRRPAGRRPAATSAPKPRIAKTASFPAPVGGWIKNQSLATPGARMPDGSKVNGAAVLQNWFPTATGNRMRGGSAVFAEIGDAEDPVTAMFVYANGNNEKLFATTSTAIYDITTPVTPTNLILGDDLGNLFVDDLGNYLITQLSVPAADVTDLGSGEWSTVQFATPGGVFLRAVNGVDTPLLYDGAGWSETPAITGTGLDPATLSYVWVHQRRLFFIKKNSLSAWYLPADSIGGAAVELPLGGVFTSGGSLLFGSAWSIESGNGPNEYCVFVTTEGEVAVFQGSDPGTASTWQKVGVYKLGRPLGANAHIRAGGDLVIATDIGFIPLSQATQRDVSALSPAAISYKIETAWNDAVLERTSAGWPCQVWPNKQMVLVALPTRDGDEPQMFAANARTGAWGLFTGWNGTCLQTFRGRLFFGSINGKIVEAEVSGADEGKPYTAACVPLFDYLKAPASLKTSQTMRSVVRAPAELVPKMSLQSDFDVSLPPPPDDPALPTSGVWDGGVWDESRWAIETDLKTFERWHSVGGQGYALAPALQITSGNLTVPEVELVQIDITYDQGDVGS